MIRIIIAEDDYALCSLVRTYLEASGYEVTACRNGEEVKCISLTADKNAIKKRLEKDIAAGIRKADIIERSLERLPLYDRLDTIKINTDNKTAEEISLEISAL